MPTPDDFDIEDYSFVSLVNLSFNGLALALAGLDFSGNMLYPIVVVCNISNDTVNVDSHNDISLHLIGVKIKQVS